MTLVKSGVAHVIREVSLKAKPDAMIGASFKGTVPVLVLPDGVVIDESLDIMCWALRQNDPESWQSSSESIGAAMLELIAANDGPFKFHLDRVKYANRYPGSNPAEHRIEAIKLLMSLEQRLCKHACLFGNATSLADVAIFPFVRQFAHADTVAFASEPLPSLQAWLARWESSVLFQSVMTKQSVWQPTESA